MWVENRNWQTLNEAAKKFGCSWFNSPCVELVIDDVYCDMPFKMLIEDSWSQESVPALN